MTEQVLGVVTFATVLGCGLMAGFFYAFSVLVMKALSQLPAAEGINAMQKINVVVINPWFLSVFFATAAGSLALALFAVLTWDRPGALYLLIGGLLYLIGTLGVTIVFNVPRNDALAGVEPASARGAEVWADYLVTWTA